MRWILRMAVTLVTLAVVFLVALAFVPADRVARLAADRVELATGRTLTLGGVVRPTLWPVIGVRTGPVELGNAAWSDAGPLLRAEAMEIGLDPAALLSGQIRVRRIDIAAPVLTLERGPDGQSNWDMGGDSPNAPGAGGTALPENLTLDEVTIRGANLRYTDRATGARIGIDGLDATLRMPAADGPLTATFAARHAGSDLSVELTLDEAAAFLGGAVSGVSLAAETATGANALRFSGRAGIDPPAAQGTLDLRIEDVAAAARLAGQVPPAIPAGVADIVRLEGEVTLAAEGTAHLRGGTLRVGPNRLSAEADITPGPDRPRLTARLSAGTLDLSAMTPAGGGGRADGVAATGWPADPIDASTLGAVDGSATLTADAIRLPGLTLGRTDIVVALDRARAVATLREVALHGGTLSGSFVVNNRDGLSMGGDLRVEGLALAPALTELADIDRLAGTGTATLDFLAVGNSVDALIRGLSGAGQIALSDGAILGLDLAGMLRTLDLSYRGSGQRTIFDSVTGRFAIDGGVLRNEDLRFVAPLLTAEGAGTVDLGGRSVDYRLVPTALADDDGSGGVRVPLLIAGPWAAPRLTLDVEALARDRLRSEAEELERRAREALEAEAADRGIARQEGESLGDAARRTLEDRAREELQDEAGRALRRLLGE